MDQVIQLLVYLVKIAQNTYRMELEPALKYISLWVWELMVSVH